MTVHDGFWKFELRERFLDRPAAGAMEFQTTQDAIAVLTRLQWAEPDFMLTVRRLVAGEAIRGCSRSSDRKVIEQAAAMLCSGWLVLTREVERPQLVSARVAKASDRPSPFPLAERRPSKPVASTKAAVVDPPTFPAGLFAGAQANALVAAAQQGTPFCPI